MGESAFYCCSTLASVEIPAGVTSIGTAVFYECTGLTSVYMLSETPPSLGVDVFKGSSELVIYVPKGSLATYRADSEWSKYNLIEFDATAIENVADDALSLLRLPAVAFGLMLPMIRWLPFTQWVVRLSRNLIRTQARR